MGNNSLNKVNTPYYKKILFVIIALFGISFVTMIHELGHYTFAKMYNIPVSTFSIGFGPTIYEKEIDNTRFQLSLLPLGGYVSVAHIDTNSKNNRFINYINHIYDLLFKALPYYKKILIYLGGIIFNLIFGSSIILLLYLFNKLPSVINKLRIMLSRGKLNSKSSIQGPIYILYILYKSAQNGILFFLFFIALLNINLAIINMIPIPIFDGGQVLIVTLEYLIGPINENIINYTSNIFIALLILFTIYISIKDVKRLS